MSTRLENAGYIYEVGLVETEQISHRHILIFTVLCASVIATQTPRLCSVNVIVC